MKPHLLAAVALAALGGIANAQSNGDGKGSGSGTASPSVPEDRAPAKPSTHPPVPGDPATRSAPNVPVKPSPPSTPVAGAPGGHEMSADRSRHMEAARRACANLSGDEARQACVRQHAPSASASGGDGALQGETGRSSQGSDTQVSPGTGSGGGEAGGSKGGAGFPKGTMPNTGDGKSPGKAAEGR